MIATRGEPIFRWHTVAIGFGASLMRSASIEFPNWLLAAMVASGAWFGLESGRAHPDPRGPARGDMRLLAMAPATGWAARSLAPVRTAGCAAGLMLLLIWGLRVLACGDGEPVAARSAPHHSSSLVPNSRRAAWLRLLRRGGRYGP